MYKDIFESIRNEAEKRNLRERTIQLYCSDVSYFLRWIGKNVSDLTLEDAESFLTAKRLEGRSPETHNHYRSAIKFLYKKVLKTVWDDDTVPAMKRERNLPAVLSRDEINAIIDATPNLKHKAIIATMYSSGLRVSEVVHLHYDDISRTNMTIHVRETKGRIDRYTILSQKNLDLLTEYWFKCGRPKDPRPLGCPVNFIQTIRDLGGKSDNAQRCAFHHRADLQNVRGNAFKHGFKLISASLIDIESQRNKEIFNRICVTAHWPLSIYLPGRRYPRACRGSH